MKIGYMRVSTNDQSTDLQEDALKKDGLVNPHIRGFFVCGMMGRIC